jgi:ATP-dependent helicase/nuclease subunit A
VNQVFTTSPPQPATLWQPAFESLDAGREDTAGSLGSARLLLPEGIEQRDVPAEDARFIAAYIRAEVDARRRSFGDFLILTRRKRNRLGPFAGALEQARVPYEVSGSGSLIESEYVQALVTLLHSLTHPDDGISLTGVLRGHCFGFSDPELYVFRKSGGVFRLSAPVDQTLSGDIADALRELQEWRGLVRRLPAGAAIETILERSSLLARASAASAGGGEAGKLLFAQDCLRASCDAGMTLGDAIAALEEAQESDESDAPVLEPGRRDVVRVMNLHKAKGLEAKVVFLADPLAGAGPRANIRIVREGPAARGYLAITRPKGEFHREMLAHPTGWARHQEEELRFVEGEERRLLYVASTRACETLVVSEWLGRPRGTVTQPWAALKPSLEGRPSLPLLASPVDTVRLIPDLSAAARDAAAASRAARREQMQAPAFRAVAISAMAAHGARGVVERGGDECPAGRDWGSLIHALLDYSVVNLACSREDLAAVARWQAAGSARLLADVPAALDAVERVHASALWERVRQAEERHTEVPLAARMDGDPVSLARGIVDLALKYPEGWHIVDYKTDFAPVAQLVEMYGEQVRAYAALWQKITGERVVFAGLYSVREVELTWDVRDAVRGV